MLTFVASSGFEQIFLGGSLVSLFFYYYYVFAATAGAAAAAAAACGDVEVINIILSLSQSSMWAHGFCLNTTCVF